MIIVRHVSPKAEDAEYVTDSINWCKRAGCAKKMTNAKYRTARFAAFLTQPASNVRTSTSTTQSQANASYAKSTIACIANGYT